jgi:hypothetical protein
MRHLTKAFDMLPRHLARDRLLRLGYPALQLRIPMTSYSWPTFLLFGCMAGTLMEPKRGIRAGSTLAMYELLGTLVPDIDEKIAMMPEADVTLNVDDLNVASKAKSTDELLATLPGGMLHLADRLRGAGMEISLPKAFTLGSTAEVARRLSEAIGVLAGEHGTAVRRLGVDHSVGRGCKRHAVRRTRLKQHRDRTKRIWQVIKRAKVRISPLKVHCAGAVLAVMYGAEFAQWTKTDLTRLNAEVAMASGSSTMAIPSEFALIAVPAGNILEFQAVAAPLLRWSREVSMASNAVGAPGRGVHGGERD